jgi:rhodanese-related sulfurtransferase
VAELTRRFHLPSALSITEARISPEAARDLLDSGALLVDVRRQDDPTAALPGALRLTPDRIPGYVARFPRDVPIVLACA